MNDTSHIEQRLARNRIQREAAEAKREALMRQLAELLVQGRAAGLPVAVMSRTAGISRETAHKLLRREHQS